MVAGILIALWFYLPSTQDAFRAVGDLKRAYGLWFSAISTAIMGGLLPWLVLAFRGEVPTGRHTSQCLFFMAFFAYKGIEVDVLYRAQDAFFGPSDTTWVWLAKIFIDQFVYNPVWAAASGIVAFRWSQTDLSWTALRQSCRAVFPIAWLATLVATWVVWVPAVAIIYKLPTDLQHPLFCVILFFFVLVANLLATHDKDASPNGSAVA